MAKKKTQTNDLRTNPELSAAPEPASPPDTALASETAVEMTEPAPKKKGGKRKAASAEATLDALAEGYLAHLEASGKSNGTIFSYRLELAVAQDELGAETRLANLTPEKVLAFFVSDRVTKTRTGVLKARVSVLKTQRVLRQALVWAAEQGLVAAAPLPEDAATF